MNADRECINFVSTYIFDRYIFFRTGGGFQVQAEEEVSVELIEERERAIRQLEVLSHGP